jgi:hypothetical protein
MKIFVVNNEVEKNIWSVIKHNHIVMDVIDFLKKIAHKGHKQLDFHNKKILDHHERSIICLELTNNIDKKFAKMNFINQICGLFDQIYRGEKKENVFNYKNFDGVYSKQSEKLLNIAQQVFTAYNSHLEEHNLIDRTDFISKCLESAEINGHSSDHGFKSVTLHDSIDRIFPKIRKTLNLEFED